MSLLQYHLFENDSSKYHCVQAEAGGARGPAWSRFGELFLALLHLMLDRAACLLSLDIQVGTITKPLLHQLPGLLPVCCLKVIRAALLHESRQTAVSQEQSRLGHWD